MIQQPSSSSGRSRSLEGYSGDFADDDGQPAPDVRTALAAAERAATNSLYLDAVVQLCLSRLLVPLMAAGDQTRHQDATRHAEMAAVLLEQPDGRRAMLAFTGTDALTAWHAEARPVPATLDVVADTAMQSRAGTLLIDIAGPHPLVIEGAVLENLALARRLVRLPDESYGWLATTQPSEPGPSGD